MSRNKHFLDRVPQVRKRTWRWSVLVAVTALAVLAAGCGGGDDGGSTPASDPADLEAATQGAPPKLAALHDQADELLPGGTAAFEDRLGALRGYPVVVNKWASWCGPCRAEFPFFQSQAAKNAKRIAFVGVNSNDGEDSAREFLAEFPVPYPSYLDPKLEIAAVIDAAVEFPATAFYDKQGELAYVRRGGYASEEELAADIERYAR